MFFLIKATNEVISNVPKSTQAEMNAAVFAATKAFESWSQTSILSRQQILFAYQGLIKSNMVKLKVHIIHLFQVEVGIYTVLIFQSSDQSSFSCKAPSLATPTPPEILLVTPLGCTCHLWQCYYGVIVCNTASNVVM